MKIGVFDPYLDDLGGGEKYMMLLASCLAKEHDVTVFWDKESDVDAVKDRFGLALNNITIGKNIFSKHIRFFERMKLAKRFDAIIILSDGSIPFLFPAKVYLHIQQPLPKQTGSGFKNKIKRRYISAIFYNSGFTKKFNDRLFPGVKSTVIYPPVALGARDQGLGTRKENIIVHVGRFRVMNAAGEDFKKQGFMVDAFKELVDQGFNGWKFIIAASVKKEDREKFQQLQKRADGYPIEFRINKTNKELFETYQSAKIYWHASGFGEDLEQHPELAEHFGISTVEAMGYGAVPVVIATGGQKEIVTNGKNGLLWSTREELYKKTKELAKDEKLWQELSRNAIIRAKDFSEEKFCENVCELITR